MNVDLFFSSEPFCVRRAKDICAGCPARKACLEEALRTSRILFAEGRPDHDVGIFGGLTGPERQQLICPDTVSQSQGDSENDGNE